MLDPVWNLMPVSLVSLVFPPKPRDKECHEVAKRLLDAMLRLEAGIKTYRHGCYANEQAAFDAINSAAGEVNAAFNDARILFGERLAVVKRPLKECVDDFACAVSDSQRARQSDSDLAREQAWKRNKPLIHASDKRDAFAKRLHKAIRRVERKLGPHLGRSWWSR